VFIGYTSSHLFNIAGSFFELDPINGQLFSNIKFDRENKEQYSVKIQAFRVKSTRKRDISVTEQYFYNKCDSQVMLAARFTFLLALSMYYEVLLIQHCKAYIIVWLFNIRVEAPRQAPVCVQGREGVQLATLMSLLSRLADDYYCVKCRVLV